MFLLPPSYWKIRTTKEKGRGVFAARARSPGTIIGDYLGRVVRPEDDEETVNSLYGMHAHDAFVFSPNKETIGIHLINHSCMPNCAMYPYKGHILYIALRRIFPGEELTVSYMVEPAEVPDGLTYTCYCRTVLCQGTMVVSQERARAFWDVFVKKHMGTYYNHIGTPYGVELPFLPEYPSVVADEFIYPLFGCSGQKPHVLRTTTLPHVSDIRTGIRETGRFLLIPALHCIILGEANGVVVYRDMATKGK